MRLKLLLINNIHLQTFKHAFSEKTFWQMWLNLEFVSKGSIDDLSALVRVKVCRRMDLKLLHKLAMSQIVDTYKHIYEAICFYAVENMTIVIIRYLYLIHFIYLNANDDRSNLLTHMCFIRSESVYPPISRVVIVLSPQFDTFEKGDASINRNVRWNALF